MTNIHFPTDGQGTQALKQKNKTNESSFHIDAVAPDAKNQNQTTKDEKKESDTQNNEPNNSATLEIEQPNNLKTKHLQVEREDERRKNNRRSENIPVILNTRSAQDRRKNSGKREEDINNSKKIFGVDTEA